MGKTARVLSSAAAHTAANVPHARNGFASAAGRATKGFRAHDADSLFGYATKINDAIEGLEKTIALAKSGFAMVSSSLPTQDVNVVASQLEADLVLAQREIVELSEKIPQARYFCAGSLGRLAKTVGDCRDYLTGFRQGWNANQVGDTRKIAEEMGSLHRRLKKDLTKFRKEVQQVAGSRKEKASRDMQMVPAGFDHNQPQGGWGFGGPAAGQGWGGPPDMPGGATPPPPQLPAPPAPPGMVAANAQRYGAPFGYGGDASMMLGHPNGGGDWGMQGFGGGAATNLSLSPAAYGAAFGYNGGPVSTGQQGPLFPHPAGPHASQNQGAALMPFGTAAAAATAAAAFASHAQQQKPAMLPPTQTHRQAASGPLAPAASPASAVQWDPEGRLHYFHPSHQRWYFCPMGSEQGLPYYFHPITDEKYFLPNALGW